MKFTAKTSLMLLLILTLVLAACGPAATPTPQVSPTPSPSPTLPAPGVRTTPAPDAEAAVRGYLEAWQRGEYEAMYSMLTAVSRDAITQEDFVKRYTNAANETALQSLEFEILSALTSPRNAQVAYRTTMNSVLVGAITREGVMNLSLEEGVWKSQWDDTLILPELTGGNTLWMDRYIPARANIYDRAETALVAQADAVSIGLDTGLVDPEKQGGLLSLLWQVTGQRPETHPDVLEPLLDSYRLNGWYLPVGEVDADTASRYNSALNSYDGVLLTPYRARFYFEAGLAPHVVGYVSAIQEAESDTFLQLGYARDERVGRSGLERWAEPYLSGTRGGALYVLSPQNKIVTKLAESESNVSQSVYTTLDYELQLGAQRALTGFRGAVVVLERDTGRVLAIASSPGFDPNAFEFTNPNSGALLQEYFGSFEAPFLNRATQGLYPLGSVFKIITMAAGLDTGVFTADSTYQCGYFFEELPGVTLNDWTWEHQQRGDDTAPSGLLTLPEGLMRSCNPYFWHIGLALYSQGYGNALADMARGFGLGTPTGIVGLTADEEQGGQILNPNEPIDAVNNAIGQGATQVTPIQVAVFVAAIGNGGTLYRPQLIETIAPPGEAPTYVFAPQEIGQLPLSPENLKIIQDAMVSVVNNPRGTAYFVLGSYSQNYIAIAGKTGTAQDPPREPHAWFAGYTYEGRANKPDIAIAVVLENAGEGSEFAAPVFRGIAQLYFDGTRAKFPWEAAVGVLKTPTPDPDEEGTPEPDATQSP